MSNPIDELANKIDDDMPIDCDRARADVREVVARTLAYMRTATFEDLINLAAACNLEAGENNDVRKLPFHQSDLE